MAMERYRQVALVWSHKGGWQSINLRRSHDRHLSWFAYPAQPWFELKCKTHKNIISVWVCICEVWSTGVLCFVSGSTVEAGKHCHRYGAWEKTWTAPLIESAIEQPIVQFNQEKVPAKQNTFSGACPSWPCIHSTKTAAHKLLSTLFHSIFNLWCKFMLHHCHQSTRVWTLVE